MTRADDRLKALFAEDLPPARDAGFVTEVMERVAREELRRDLALLAGASVLGATVLGMAWPTVGPALALVAEALTPAALALAIGLTVVAPFTGRALGLLHARS